MLKAGQLAVRARSEHGPILLLMFARVLHRELLEASLRITATVKAGCWSYRRCWPMCWAVRSRSGCWKSALILLLAGCGVGWWRAALRSLVLAIDAGAAIPLPGALVDPADHRASVQHASRCWPKTPRMAPATRLRAVV